jgi:hypothetical protein
VPNTTRRVIAFKMSETAMQFQQPVESDFFKTTHVQNFQGRDPAEKS